jgi:cystathionine gamma-synthase
MLFSNAGAAEACKEFMISVERHGEKAIPPNRISLFPLGVTCDNEKGEQGNIPVLYAVLYPEESFPISSTFWRLTGTGISSRLAEKALQYTDSLQEMTDALNMSPPQTPHPVFSAIRSRVSDLIERAPLHPERARKVAENDVYLYPSGMSAIYHIHQMLGEWRGMESVITGFPYELTIAIMETYGPGFKFYSLGTDRELEAFEKHLEQLHNKGQKIQAAWCECPSNPLLRTVDLERVRRLAVKYDFPVVCDDTIGSFANVDVSDIADIVITSLTKSFNGFADLLAGR